MSNNSQLSISEAALRDIALELGTQTINRILLSDLNGDLQRQIQSVAAAEAVAKADADTKASRRKPSHAKLSHPKAGTEAASASGAPPRERSRGKRSPAK